MYYNNSVSKVRKTLPIIILLILAAILRFQNLGYSEFQDDEKKAFIRSQAGANVYEFFMNQRKGPMQFLVTSATMLIHNDPRNELLVRIPFTIINLLSVLVFYLILKEVVKSDLAAFFGTLLYLANGFVVGFSRIAQYQNLNLLFSLLSLLFFIKLPTNTKTCYRNSILGTLFFSLSLLSHWDAIFYLVPSIYFYLRFLTDRSVEKKTKIDVFAINVVLASLLLLPFLVPYLSRQANNPLKSEYFQRRVGFSSYPLERHKFIFELYNPFITLYLLSVLAFIGSIKIRKNYIYILWFLINFLLIRFFMQKPGTHIYNYVIPAIVLASFGINLMQKFKKMFKFGILPLVTLLTVFIYYQSYMIFVINTTEYPWDGKVFVNTRILKLEKPVYTDDEILTFGFPHFRNWKYVAQIVLNDPDDCGYITNEEKSISQIYLPDNYGIPYNKNCYYVADVRRPFVTEGKLMVFAETVDREPLYTYKRDGKKLLRLYKIVKE